MTSDAVVVDVSRDWAIACDVQRRFMQGLGRAAAPWTTARDAGRCTPWGAIAMISCPSRINAWH
jgi:hypothetical protein